MPSGSLLSKLMWPIRRLLDPRFADVGRRIDYARDQVIDESRQLESGQAELSTLVNTFGAASNESLAFHGRHMREFEDTLSDLTDRVHSIDAAVAAVFDEKRVDALMDGGIEGLDAQTARLLNFSESHR